MSGNVIVVTGCTQGLGFHAVKTLANNLGKLQNDSISFDSIVLSCRNVPVARKVAKDLAAKTKSDPGRFVVLDEPCDLSDIVSVRTYATALSKFLGERKIIALVNNAGMGGNPDYRKTQQGHELIWATNHLGHFLLTILCLKNLKEGSRIVNVSSEVHDPASKTPLPDPGQHWPQSVDEYNALLARGEPIPGENARASGGRRYSRSKLCNIMFTYELARRLSGAVPYGVSPAAAAASRSASFNGVCTLQSARSIQVVAMNPGLMLDSGFVVGVAGWFMGLVAWLLSPLLRLTPLGRLMRSAPTSGADLARLALPATAGGEGLTAGYYDGTTLSPSSEFSRAAEAVKRQVELWEHSLRWAKVTPDELRAAGLI